MPEMSAARRLFVCGSTRTKSITYMSKECVADHHAGQVVNDASGVFVSARLPACARLQHSELAALDDIARAWLRRGRTTRRGDAHAAVFADYLVAGYKGDQDTGLAMFSSRVADTDSEQRAYLNVMGRLRTALLKLVLPKVEKYFFSLLDCVRDDFFSMGMRFAYVDYMTTASMGDLFASRMHVDDDAWMTVVVALGECESGGEWAHAACGAAHAVHAGDIFLVNPAMGHGTAVFGDQHATRRLIALFVSENAFRACLTSHEVAVAHGLQAWEPASMMSRKRKRGGAH